MEIGYPIQIEHRWTQIPAGPLYRWRRSLFLRQLWQTEYAYITYMYSPIRRSAHQNESQGNVLTVLAHVKA